MPAFQYNKKQGDLTMTHTPALVFLAFFAVAVWSFVCLGFVEVPNSTEKRFSIYIPISLLDFSLAVYSLWLFKNITYTGTIDWKKAR